MGTPRRSESGRSRGLDMWRHAATFLDKILGRETCRPPGRVATTFATVVNLKAAKAIGVEMRATILAQADEVIA